MNILKLDGRLRVKGNSGQLYYFDEYFFHPSRPPHIHEKSGVYLFLRKKNDGKYYPVFCGETCDLADSNDWKADRKEILSRKPNRVCVLDVMDKSKRAQIEQDILKNEHYDFLTYTLVTEPAV